jgi:hypothetical protein
MSARALLALTWFLAAACSPSSGPLRVSTTVIGSDTRLSLVSPPELRINARLKPVLELSDGRIVRFDSGSLTPDSAYFAAPPTALLPGRHPRVRGTLRVSVCDTGALTCRSISVQL